MAVFQQERHVELNEESRSVFVITSSLVSFTAGELPHTNVFVLTIITREDPKDDVLARVASIADLTELPQGRDSGLASATGTDILYLSSTCTLQYFSLDEAIAAQGAIKDRVNALITSWQTFDTEFNAPDPTPATYTLPSVDLSQLCTLVEAYKVAKQDRYQKELTETAADATKTAAEADLTTKQGLLNAAEVSCTLRVTLTALVATATTALTNAQVALIEATQELTSALAIESDALDEVLVLDPDFDKYTIPLVDDVPPGP